jgi:Na+-transporting methylmalonyl-CoA/oxaloacetate decarboxylase beta subunit
MDIGVIGGADGPTTIFVSSSISKYVFIAVTILCIAVFGIIIWTVRKRKSKHS